MGSELDCDLAFSFRARMPSCSRPSRRGLEAAERAVRSACRPSLTAAARAGCWIRRPGRKNAPQGPNQRMERQGDDRGCRRRRGASGPPTTTAFRFPFPHAV